MASVVETRPEGRVYKCPDSVKIPENDLLTFLFGKSPGRGGKGSKIRSRDQKVGPILMPLSLQIQQSQMLENKT